MSWLPSHQDGFPSIVRNRLEIQPCPDRWEYPPSCSRSRTWHSNIVFKYAFYDVCILWKVGSSVDVMIAETMTNHREGSRIEWLWLGRISVDRRKDINLIMSPLAQSALGGPGRVRWLRFVQYETSPQNEWSSIVIARWFMASKCQSHKYWETTVKVISDAHWLVSDSQGFWRLPFHFNHYSCFFFVEMIHMVRFIICHQVVFLFSDSFARTSDGELPDPIDLIWDAEKCAWALF
jgi:hypothetical protein